MRLVLIVGLACGLAAVGLLLMSSSTEGESPIITESSTLGLVGDASVIPKEVKMELRESEMLQDFDPSQLVETTEAATSASKVRSPLNGWDNSDSSLAKRTKAMIADDLSPHRFKAAMSGKSVEIEASHKTAHQKVTQKKPTKASGAAAKAKASATKAGSAPVKPSKKGTAKAIKKLTKARKDVAKHKALLAEARKAVKAAASAEAKKAAKAAVGKAKKAVKKAQAKHKKAKAAAGGSLAVCKAGCATGHILEYKATCEEQCLKTDYVCRRMCGRPLRQCECKCHHDRIWECEGARCDCWTFVSADSGPVAKAMMHAENKALAKGLGATVAEKEAVAEQNKVMTTPSKAEKSAAKAAARKEALLAEETRQWMRNVHGL